MGYATYEEFREAFMSRHQNVMSSGLSTVGSALPLVGGAAAAVTRRPRWLGLGLVAGVVVASVAHLCQPGTLRAEYAGILRHPRWAALAERERIFGSFSL